MEEPAGELDVYRLNCNTPRETAQNGAGFCGTIPATAGYEEAIKKAWGGGKYKILNRSSTPRLEQTLTIPGPSKRLPPVRGMPW